MPEFGLGVWVNNCAHAFTCMEAQKERVKGLNDLFFITLDLK